MAKSSNSVASFVVFGSDGSVDVTSTVVAFEESLLEYAEKRTNIMVAVARAVEAVFDQYPRATINMPAVITFAMGKLPADNDSYDILKESIESYVRNNPSYLIKKGKGGGVSRIG